MTRSTNDPAIKKSVSFPGSLLAKAERRCRALGWNLSQYVQHLMREDIIKQAPVTRVAEQTEVFHHTPTPAETAARKSPVRYTKQPAAKKKPAR